MGGGRLEGEEGGFLKGSERPDASANYQYHGPGFLP